jgi:hypothetical protein
MHLPYKEGLGARVMGRAEFLQAFRAARACSLTFPPEIEAGEGLGARGLVQCVPRCDNE